MNIQLWLKGLASAALGGAGAGAAQMINSTGHVTVATAVSAGIGALMTTIAYLIQSPLAPAVAPTSQK